MYTMTIEPSHSTEKQILELINKSLYNNSLNNNLNNLPQNLKNALKKSDVYIEEYKNNIEISFELSDDYFSPIMIVINKLTMHISYQTRSSDDYLEDEISHLFLDDDYC